MKHIENGRATSTAGTSHNRQEGNNFERRPEQKRERDRSSRERNDVEADGTLNNKIGDAPGQNCHYILSGFHNHEFYRLGTFGKFPENVPIKVSDLAEAGFYYTGFRDRAKCFSCGMAVENWMMGDYGLDQRWHKSDCKMKNGHDVMNVPIAKPNFRSLLRQYMGNHEPVQGINSLNLGHRNYSPARSPDNDMDITESHMSGYGASNAFPALIFADIPVQEHENFLKRINLKSEAERRQTFAKWPTFPAPLLPSELAKQGFFYLGNLDRTQCFSCSGVLRNWSPTDDVSEQHRKHFPQCRMVRQVPSGNIPMTENQRRNAEDEYQIRLSQLNPTSPVEPPDPTPEEQQRLQQHFPCRRPANPHMKNYQSRLATFSNQGWPNRIRATPEQIAKAGFFFLGEGDRTKCYYCNGGLQNWEENDEPFTEHARWFPGCELILRMKGHAFVRRICDQDPNLNRPTIRNPASYDIPPPPCAGEVQHVGTAHGQANPIAAKQMMTQENTVSSRNEASASSTPKDEVAKNLMEIQEQTICRNCKVRDAEVVLLPCGHLCSCEECAKKAEFCFICHKPIKDILKAYRA